MTPEPRPDIVERPNLEGIGALGGGEREQERSEELVAVGEWVAAGAVEDVPPGSALVVDDLEPPVALFNVDGTFYATDDTCSHARSSLAGEGYFEDDVVECAYHFARFCVRDGRVMSPPARIALRTHEVRMEGDQVFVRRSL